MRTLIEKIVFYWFNRNKRTQEALETFSKAIRTYMTMLVVVGPSAVRQGVTTSFGAVEVDNNLSWEDFRFIDDGMTPLYKKPTDTPQPYGYIRFDFFGTKFSRYFVMNLHQKLIDEGYNLSLYNRGYYISIFISTDKVYGENPFPFLPKEN